MNKNYIKIAFIIAVVALFFACRNKADAPNGNAPVETQIYKSVGVVKAIDAVAGSVTVDHEDIPGYMTAMQMTVAVSDPKMIEAIKAGDKVEFELERSGSNLKIIKLNRIGEAAIINGGEIYKTNCAECHGGAGEGAEKGISLLKGHALKHSEKEYIEQVTKGDGDKMPAFRNKLSKEQIAAVVRYVREELQKDVKREETTEHLH